MDLTLHFFSRYDEDINSWCIIHCFAIIQGQWFVQCYHISRYLFIFEICSLSLAEVCLTLISIPLSTPLLLVREFLTYDYIIIVCSGYIIIAYLVVLIDSFTLSFFMVSTIACMMLPFNSLQWSYDNSEQTIRGVIIIS